MKHKPELVSGLVDGQLRGLRRWLAERHLRRCMLCQADYRHTQHVRRLLAAHPPKAEMPEDAAFFWSKVKREIEARGTATVAVPEPKLTLADWLGQHTPALASATATILFLGIAAAFHLRPTPATTVHARPLSPIVVGAATVIQDSTATPLPVSDQDVTVIWVNGLPWTPNMTEMKTLYASLDT